MSVEFQLLWPADYQRAKSHPFDHRSEVQASELCGCFSCLQIVTPTAVTCWTDEDAQGVAQTALCPFCGEVSVLGSRSEYPITVEFLRRMREFSL
jgi:hypothetical protein